MNFCVYGKLKKCLTVNPWKWGFLKILCWGPKSEASLNTGNLSSLGRCAGGESLWRLTLQGLRNGKWRTESWFFLAFQSFEIPSGLDLLSDRAGRQLKHYSSSSLMHVCIEHSSRSQVMNPISQDSNEPINTPREFYTFFPTMGAFILESIFQDEHGDVATSQLLKTTRYEQDTSVVLNKGNKEPCIWKALDWQAPMNWKTWKHKQSIRSI